MPLDLARMWHDLSMSFGHEICDECLAPIGPSLTCFYCGDRFPPTTMTETQPTEDLGEQLCQECGGEIFRYSCPECFLSRINPKDDSEELRGLGQKFTIDESTDLI